MADISINNVVRVTLALSEIGMSAKNVNAVALFTNDAPINLTDPYVIAKNASTVETYFGTNSLTHKMASAIFAQSKNLISGNGYLAVIPMQNAVSATAPRSDFEVEDEAETLASLIAVSNGAIKVTTGGIAYDITNIDFTSCASLKEVAKVLDGALVDCEVDYDTGAKKFKIASKVVGTAATITVANSSSTGATQIKALLGEESAVVGANASGESLVEAIARTKNAVAFCGIVSTLVEEDAKVKETSSYVAGLQDNIYGAMFHSVSAIEGAAAEIKSASEHTTRCFCYGKGTQADAKIALAAYFGRAFSTNFSASNTSQTMNLKSLASVEPDNCITENLYAKAKENGVDLYVNYDNGLARVLSTGANSFFDTVYENMAFRFQLQANMFNALGTTSTKIPQTENGMAILRSACSQACIQFKSAGVFAAGTWNGSDTFGNPETFKNNIAGQGYYIYSLPITQQNQQEREQRIAPVIQVACKRAGALHEADVIVNIEN